MIFQIQILWILIYSFIIFQSESNMIIFKHCMLIFQSQPTDSDLLYLKFKFVNFNLYCVIVLILIFIVSMYMYFKASGTK